MLIGEMIPPIEQARGLAEEVHWILKHKTGAESIAA